MPAERGVVSPLPVPQPWSRRDRQVRRQSTDMSERRTVKPYSAGTTLAHATAVFDALNSRMIAQGPKQGHCGVNTVKRMRFPIDGNSGHVSPPQEFLFDSIVAQIALNKR